MSAKIQSIRSFDRKQNRRRFGLSVLNSKLANAALAPHYPLFETTPIHSQLSTHTHTLLHLTDSRNVNIRKSHYMFPYTQIHPTYVESSTMLKRWFVLLRGSRSQPNKKKIHSDLTICNSMIWIQYFRRHFRHLVSTGPQLQ